MEFAIGTLVYALSCNSEDYNVSEHRLKAAKKNKDKELIEFYKEELIELSKNINDLKKALKILRKENEK